MIKLSVKRGEYDSVLEAISTAYPHIPMRVLASALKASNIKVNGEVIKKDAPLVFNSEIEAYLTSYGYDAPCSIVYSDANLYIINRQPLTDDEELTAAVEGDMEEQGVYSLKARIVPMLCMTPESDSGGLTVFATNEEIMHAFMTALMTRRIRRFYRAIVKGKPEEGELVDRLVPKRQIGRQQGRTAIVVSNLKVISTHGECSVVEIEPITNEPHQICAQMARRGYPVLGDHLYGDKRFNKKYSAKYPALWLNKLQFQAGKTSVLDYMSEVDISTDSINFPVI